ncbi:MAG TPA: carboxyl transferase domain-containing protein [Alphaproteobacteria bacterium]|nr:carboxyl transferase domain-containing protein [Alphaproteobacteria bacterium]
MTWDKHVEEIAAKRGHAKTLGGEEAVARHHAKGRLTVRERIEALLDAGSFREVGGAAGGAERDETGALTGFTPANFVLGFGAIAGRACIVGGEDFTLKGGSPNAAGLRKSVYTEELALQYRLPLVRLHEGGGGSVAGSGGGTVGDSVAMPPRFQSVARTMKAVPVASAALGAVAGLPASRLVASHFSVMTKESQVMVAGPAVVERALNHRPTKEELGGPEIHARNGAVDNLAEDEADALAQIRAFLGYMPQNAWEVPPVAATQNDTDRRDEALLTIVPESRRRAYDMRALLAMVVDEASLFEMGKLHGRGMITVLARIAGQPVGIFANDCMHYAGAMTAAGAQKLTRFIAMCETFHLPIITFIDEPGFMIGPDAERAATIRHGTDAVLAAADASVPWASIIVRKNFGVASAAHYGPGAYVLAWPSAELGAVPAEGGVAVAFGREIAAAADPEARRKELETEMAARQTPAARAESFSMHDLIDPRETRPALCDWIARVQPLLPGLIGPPPGVVNGG